MHKLKCLILILCFTSMQVAFADSISATPDAEIAAQQTACAANTAMVWSTKLGRCVGTQAAVDARAAAATCDAMTDLEAKKKCNLALAEKSTGLSSDTGSLSQGSTTSSMVMNGLTTAYAATNIITTWGAEGKNSSCTSKSIFAAASVAGLASDVYLKMSAKKKVKELEGKYTLATKSTAMEAQVQALQYLKEEQQTVVSIAGMEKKRDMMLMMGYGLAAGWAVYEMTPYGANPDCVPDAKSTKTTSSDNKTVDGNAANPPANAPAAKPAATGLVEQMKSAVPSSFKEYLQSSMGIAIISGIATVYSGILYKGAAQQEKDSTANVAKVDKMIKSFQDSGANVCMNGHDDMTNAKCYCYAADGTKNSNRTNSQTCIDLWAKNDYLIAGDAANYNALAYNPDVAGCVTVDNQFDETCKCKKLISSTGANACLKSSSISLSSGALSTGLATSSVKTLADYTANATNGNPRYDLLSTATVGSQAIKAAHLAETVASKIPPADRAKLPIITESNVGKFAKAAIGEKALAAAASGSSALHLASAKPENPALSTLLQQAQAKVGIDVLGSGKGLAAVKEKKKNGIDLNFGNDSSGSSNGQVIGNFPEDKKYKMRNSDIVTDNSASIFEIISNRYVQSGLKRLFDDEAK